MRALLTFRNRIEEFYNARAGILGYLLRLVMSFLALLAMKNAIGYNTLLSQYWFIICFAVVGAFAPWRFLPLMLSVYIVAQMLSLSLGIGVVFIAVLFILYLLYFRIDKRYAAAMVLMALFLTIKMPALVPLVLAVISPSMSLVAVISSCIVYYMVHYVNLNSAVILGFTDATEETKASIFIEGLVNYKDFVYMTLIVILVFLLVHYVRKANINHANELAVTLGTGATIILQLIVQLLYGTMTYEKLWIILGGAIASGIVAIIVNYFIQPMDFSRVETLEFEDDEYYYFVRAVPKASIDKESVHVTRISSRKRILHGKDSTDKGRD